VSNIETKTFLSHLPFENLTEYEVENQFKSAKARITQLMNDHSLDNFIQEQSLSNQIDPDMNNPCDYYDENSFINLKRDSDIYLNIFSMNIRSLPKHAGELVVFLKMLETDFDVIILTEIGARNITTVECLLDDYEFMYCLPKNNMYGGVGLYISNVLSM